MSDADDRPVDPSSDPAPDETGDPIADAAEPAASSDQLETGATAGEFERQEWHEGPDEDAPPESWLGLDDDELLHRIETATPGDDDERLLEVVESDRHFFVRQEAAKRVGDHAVLFRFEDDRHIGQILVRHLTRREDVTYLERLVERSHHAEVRVAAQVQLARLWGRLGGPTRSPTRGPTLPPPEFRADVPAETGKGEEEGPGAPTGREPGAPAPGGRLRDRLDASLLGWALHFIIEEAWQHLGTTSTRGLLRRTHAELLPANEPLCAFRVEDDAHVSVDMRRAGRLSDATVEAVARWIVAFLDAGSRSADEVAAIDVRGATRLMEDALDDVGFYRAIGGAWRGRR